MTAKKKNRPKLSQRDRAIRRQVAAQEVKRGLPIRDVALRHGLSERTVAKLCVEYGVRPPRSPTARVYWVIARLMLTDVPFSSIALEFGVSVPYIGAVSRQCREAGIPVRDRPLGRPPKTSKEEERPT